MILKALTLENFKGIREPIRIELSPITLLFGPNNAGKSTVLHALIYGRELFERGNTDPRYTEMGGETIDLGGFDSLVFGNDRSRRIRMRFEFEVSAAELVDDSRNPNHFVYHTDPENSSRVKDDLDWQHSSLGIVVGEFSSVTEIVGRHSLRWLEVTIGWSEKHQRALVLSCSSGINEHDHPNIELTLNEQSDTVELSCLDLGTLRLGKSETREFAHLANQLRIEYHALPRMNLLQCVPETLWDQNTKDRFEHKKSEQERIQGIYDDAFNALSDFSISTSDFLRSLIDSENLNEAGRLKRIPVTPGLSALPDRNLWLSVIAQSHKWHPEIAEYSVLCKWNYPEGLIDHLLDPLINAYMTGLVNACRDYFSRSLYLSAIRVNPPRDFSPVLPVDPKRWSNGLAAWDLLFAKEENLLDVVNAWLNGNSDRFASGFEVKIQHVKQVDVRQSPVLELLTNAGDVTLDQVRRHLLELPEHRLLRIRNLTTGALGHPRDIGYGLSQLLPVIVAALDTKTSFISVEEPESNIHPAFQVVLADLFISQAKANPGALFLIETHSEHLMLRCLRRIRQTSDGELTEGDPSLRPDEIAVHFVEPSEGSPRFHRIRIDEDGEFLDPWPRGFFSERMKEVYGNDL